MPISAADFEPHLHLVPSVIFNGFRIRALSDKVHSRPLTETFHEFLIGVVHWAFGETWWKQQLGMPANKRHVVVRWYLTYCEFTRQRTGPDTKRADDVSYSSPATGPLWALLTLGYDLFCLEFTRELPSALLDRLRQHAAFQSARYELMTAAVLIRAGFHLEYLDEQQIREKHGEFIARHPVLGERRLVVEAKTRIRPGVLHAPGIFSYAGDARGLEELVRNALRKRPADLPFVVFLDVNFPPTPDKEVFEKPWVEDIKRVLTLLGTPSPEKADRFSLLAVTNFAYHLGAEDARVPHPEFTLILPKFAEVSLDTSVVAMIDSSLGRYHVVPDQL